MVISGIRDLVRSRGLGDVYKRQEGGLQAATARAVWVLDKQGVIQYHELTAELGHEPNYEAALEAAKALL